MPANDVAMSAAELLPAPLADDVIDARAEHHLGQALGSAARRPALRDCSPGWTGRLFCAAVFSVDVLECPKCHGRLRVIAVITEREPARRILAHLGLPTEPPTLARARDPTDDVDDDEASAQLTLGLA